MGKMKHTLFWPAFTFLITHRVFDAIKAIYTQRKVLQLDLRHSNWHSKPSLY